MIKVSVLLRSHGDDFAGVRRNVEVELSDFGELQTKEVEGGVLFTFLAIGGKEDIREVLLKHVPSKQFVIKDEEHVQQMDPAE